MIANIRVHSQGNSKFLTNLDLLKFSEEQVRGRMETKGLSDDSFFIVGFTDWSIDRTMSLKEAYLLKKYINEVCDGDDYIVKYLLKCNTPVNQIISHYYTFLTKDEEVLMTYLLKNNSIDEVVAYFKNKNNWVNAVNGFIMTREVLNTPKGFYVKKL
ncbi:hypothetical protein KB575_00585 [Streptococcus canis]|uniref:hypothetical protein n=1 Tax=Streptococcus canis TaxID=1329 RepID=UPI00294A437F|nr:hypothetical protein [Streptococcus canis]MDV5987565.1 hypothetical protein [Streptococcus canis]